MATAFTPLPYIVTCDMIGGKNIRLNTMRAHRAVAVMSSAFQPFGGLTLRSRCNSIQGDYVGFNTGNGKKTKLQASCLAISGVESYVVTLYKCYPPRACLMVTMNELTRIMKQNWNADCSRLFGALHRTLFFA